VRRAIVARLMDAPGRAGPAGPRSFASAMPEA